MKHLSTLLFVLAAATGCSKSSDEIPELRDDATAIVKYYTPRLDTLEQRLQDVLHDSGRVPKNLPGSDEATRALVDARDKLVELRNLGKNIEKQAPQLANEGKVTELQNLVEGEEMRYEEGTTFVHENLQEVESWLANAIRAQGSAKPAETPTPSATDVPATAVP